MTRAGYSVVIIGGGAIGLSAAWQLASLGVPDVLVVERWPTLGSESSSKANGGVRQQFTTPINIAFSKFSVAEFERLEREHGVLGFKQAGYLLIAGSVHTRDLLRSAFDIQRTQGVDTQWLSPDEVSELVPFVRRDGIEAGTFCASDGFIDPAGVLSIFASESRRLGAVIKTGVTVTGITPRSGGGFRLETTIGSVDADVLVNAAGVDASAIGAMVDVDLPVTPVRRNLACTEPAPGYPPLIPMTVDVDMRMAIRREVSGGFVISYSSPDDPPGRDTAFDPTFLGSVGERVGHRFPFLENIPIDRRKCWAGLYPETPDNHAIVGTLEAVPGFVVAAGFAGHGIMHSPAAGRAVAELIVEGRCKTFNLDPLRPTRFAEGDLLVEISSW